MVIHADMLLRTWKELEYRPDVICATKSAHTEVYEGKLITFESFITSHSEMFVDFNSFKLSGTGVLHLIQINHQPDATIFQFIILTFVYSSTCFGRLLAHHQELSD
jgi:hypothetical protein